MMSSGKRAMVSRLKNVVTVAGAFVFAVAFSTSGLAAELADVLGCGQGVVRA